ncbi:hypothetical protein FB451DRAFT_1369898 [Mycena latifolia]|nr:hypothetical protein FB451DRAFT_1369898 [Mycena latifolia]
MDEDDTSGSEINWPELIQWHATHFMDCSVEFRMCVSWMAGSYDDEQRTAVVSHWVLPDCPARVVPGRRTPNKTLRPPLVPRAVYACASRPSPEPPSHLPDWYWDILDPPRTLSSITPPWSRCITRDMQTPPSSPQRHQQRTCQILRDINVSRDHSPHHRPIPSALPRDENVPPSHHTTSPGRNRTAHTGRSERESANANVHLALIPTARSLEGRPATQRARRDRDRVQIAEADRMDVDVDDTRAEFLASSLTQAEHSRVLQQRKHKEPIGIRAAKDSSLPRCAQEPGTIKEYQRRLIAPVPVGTPLMAAQREYQDPEARHDLGPMDVACPHCGALRRIDERRRGMDRVQGQSPPIVRDGKDLGWPRGDEARGEENQENRSGVPRSEIRQGCRVKHEGRADAQQCAATHGSIKGYSADGDTKERTRKAL